MSKLACNVVSYRPDPELLAARFRPRQVEALLEEAALLIERCLADFGEYCWLDYTWNQFQSELESQERQLDLDIRCESRYTFERESAPAAAETAAPASAPAEQGEEQQPETAAPPEEEGEAKVQPEAVPPPVSFSRRNLDLRAEALLRKKDLSAPGRPMALAERRDLTLKRLCRDYEEAVNRAWVSEEGLKSFYGHVGEWSPLSAGQETLAESITNLSIWIRNSMEWLVGYRQQEEAVGRVVSVRGLLNRNAWAQLRHARDSFSTRLQLPTELFRGYDNCRLRGIGASLVGEAGTVPWSMVLRLPDEALYERSGQSVDADQSELPPCVLGRVENRSSVRPMEICGVNTHINASPVGRPTPGGSWSIEILKPVGGTAESFNQVEDVILEISAVGIPQRG